MANITRFSPFRDLERFSPFHELEKMFETMRMRPLGSGVMEGISDIRLDVFEDEKAYTVKADIPGVSKDDIKISIDGNQVSIVAEVKREQEQQGRAMMCSERFYGQHYRAFTLDSAIDESQAVAKYENGVLELTLPKRSGGGTHQLKVN